MKKGDYLWLSVLGLIVLILIVPMTHNIFIMLTNDHPYIMGFVKVAILATMGELLAIRINSGKWLKPVGLTMRVAIWGLIGMSFVVVFEIFSAGVSSLLQKGLLPEFAGLKTLSFAFWTSTCMNFIFAPTMMTFHRITDTYLELGKGKLSSFLSVPLGKVVGAIDWSNMIGFVFIKTLPLFWVPAHTFTFWLPPEYRVLSAAFLSIALGAILAFAKRKGTKGESNMVTHVMS